MIDFASSLRSKKLILYEVVKIWSGLVLNIYIYYISVMSLSRLWSKFFKKNNDDFNNGNIYMIYKDINDVIYIGSTCFSLKKCLSKFKKKIKIER